MTQPAPAIPVPGVRVVAAFALDVAFVAVFTFVGRLTHDEPLTPAGWWLTAWPFLVALLLGWALVVLFRRTWPTTLVEGIPVWTTTLILGMGLRALTGQGTATPFIVVATLFLGLTLLGWRLIAQRLTRR